MKKVLMVVAMLLLAMPVMAATSITAVKEGSPFQASDGNYVQTVRIDYLTDVDVRAFALDITVSDANVAANSPNFQYIRGYKTGESDTRTTTGYGIFPSRFRDFIVPTGPNWVDTNYNPTAAWDEPDTISPRTGLGFTKMTVEMGTLFQDDANKPALSGTLFRFDVNAWGQYGTFHVTIAANATRGGIVDATAAGITGVVFNGTDIVFPGGGTTVPNVLTMNRVTARSTITGLGLGVIEVNVPPTANGQLRTIIAQNPTGGTVVTPGSNVTINAVSYPVKDAAPGSMYANWVTAGRPACWGYMRQCRGDADGKAALGLWVATADLTILRGSLSKATTAIPPGGRCADFDHKAALGLWVSTGDLTILRAYISKAVSLVPQCGSVPAVPSTDANLWYYCIPTGGAACPAGQICAPIGICPNTP